MVISGQERGWRASPVLVAALVHVAGEQRNSERAEELWRRHHRDGTTMTDGLFLHLFTIKQFCLAVNKWEFQEKWDL